MTSHYGTLIYSGKFDSVIAQLHAQMIAEGITPPIRSGGPWDNRIELRNRRTPATEANQTADHSAGLVPQKASLATTENE